MGKFFHEVVEDLRQRGHNTNNSTALRFDDPQGRFTLSSNGTWHQAFYQDLPGSVATFLELQRQCVVTVHLRDVSPQTNVQQAAKELEASFQSIKGWNTWKESNLVGNNLLREKTTYFRDEILNTLSTAVELIHTVIGSAHVTLIVRTDSEEANIIDAVAAQLAQSFGAGGRGQPSGNIRNPQSGIPQSGIPQAGYQQGGIPQANIPPQGIPQTGIPQSGIPRAGVPQSGIPQGFPQQGIPQAGIPQAGIPQGNYQQGIPQQGGIPQSGVPSYPQQGIPQSGIPQGNYQGGIPQTNIPQSGIPQSGIPQGNYQQGIPQSGIPRAGVPQSGIPQAGIPQGFPQAGIPQTGTPQQGIPQGNYQQGIPQAGIPQQGIPQGNYQQGGIPQQGGISQAGYGAPQQAPQVEIPELAVVSFVPVSVSFSIPAACQVASMTRDSATLSSPFLPGVMVVWGGVAIEPSLIASTMGRLLQERGYAVASQDNLTPEQSAVQGRRNFVAALQARDSFGMQQPGLIRILLEAENFLAVAAVGALSQSLEVVLKSSRLGRILPNLTGAQELVGTWSAVQALPTGERPSYTFFADGRYQYQKGQAQQSGGALGAIWGALKGSAEDGRFYVSHGSLVMVSSYGSRAVSLRKDPQQLMINNEGFVRTA